MSEPAGPPSSNHGGHTPPQRGTNGVQRLSPQDPYFQGQIEGRIDWYQATFDDLDDERVPTTLALALGATVRRGKGRLGYAAGWDVVGVGDEALATVLGRSARLGEVHVIVTGSACDAVVPVLRRLWPLHRVSRADAAVDFLADFEHLDALALAFATDRGISYRLVTDSSGGATRYVGSPRSEVMVRLYKKSEELRQKYPEQAHEVPDGIVRAECQVRPGKREVKAAAAWMSSDELWGLAEWSALFAVSILNLAPIRTSTHFRRQSDWSRMLHWLGKQYGPAIAARSAEVGRQAAVLEVLDAVGLL